MSKDIHILYEDESILVINKPAGLVVHGDGRTNEVSVADWLAAQYPEVVEVGEPWTNDMGEVIPRPGIVHRLDRETSGVMVVAKTQKSFDFLKEQFQNRKVQKIYNAVVWGNFSPDKTEGVIEKPIGRSTSDFRKWSAEYGAKGELREAVTEYKVLTQGFFTPRNSAKQNEVGAYLEVRPKTGRTHQIRVHLKSISHPVVCDKLYGSKKSNEVQEMSYDKKENLGFDRLALHALFIKLELPNGTHIVIESPLPKEFENARQVLSQ